MAKRKPDPHQRIRITLAGFEALGEMKANQRPIDEILPDNVTALLNSDAYTVVARNVPPPFDDIDPGAVVLIDWGDVRAKWMNGVVYVATRHLKKE